MSQSFHGCPADGQSEARSPQKAPQSPGRKRFWIGSLVVLTICTAVHCCWDAEQTKADPTEPRLASTRTAPSPPRTTPQKTSTVPAIVAVVNSQRISHEELGREALRRSGKEVLESMVNKRLIEQECKRRGIQVSQAEVQAEIHRMSKRFNIPVDQWLKLLKDERGVTPEQYANDIIWPTLALRKLAGEQLTISREELLTEYETQYGDMVRVRLISVSSAEKAKRLRAEAAAHPGEFGNLAKEHSEDAASASLKGVINPIRRHGSYPEIEDAAFRMRDGEVSPVIHVGGQYVILKREGLIEARAVKFERVAPQLEEILRDRKMRGIAQEIFRQLQDKARVEIVWSDPAKRERMPGVAAMVDGVPITLRELAEDCIARHGLEILDRMINRRIIEQACRRNNVTVASEDVDREIARAAMAGVKAKPDGSPDVDAWLELMTKNHGLSVEAYRREVVWPAVALQKLVGDQVKITEDDIRKGFEANFGPRVRCLAIVLNHQRRAQQVFEMARKNNTSEHFGDLAAQYSIEPGSQALRGEVPPIQKHGGQPELEREAFSLRPGELSGIIQVGDKFILLRCEGYTEPVRVELEHVRDEIRRDLYEKKIHLAMGEYFERLQDAAVIDNYLAGTSHSPKGMSGAAPSRKSSGEASPAAQVPTLRQLPAG